MNKWNCETINKYICENAIGYKYISHEYINKRLKINIVCDNGHNVIMDMWNFQTGKRCTKCNNTRYSFEDVKTYIKNNSDCILLSEEYINNTTELLLKCKCNNNFKVTFAKFKNRNKRQCNTCGNLLKRDSFAFDINYVDKYMQENSECKLLSNNYINNNSKLEIQCKCGNIFTTSFAKFKDRNQKQCVVCSKKISIFETKVKEILESKSINYIYQYKFNDCKYKDRLIFDYAIINNEDKILIIEVDGQQHYRPIGMFGGECAFEELIIKDNIKNDYCKNNNIPILRLPYYDYKNYEKIITNYLQIKI